MLSGSFTQPRRFLCSLFTLSALSLGWSTPAAALEYSATQADSQWESATPSPLMCRLSHFIPEFGEVTFSHRSGEKVKAIIRPLGQVFPAGGAHLVALAPSWLPGQATADLGQVKIGRGEAGIEIANPQTELMLEYLQRGMQPSLLQEDKDSRYSSRIARISHLAFKPAFTEFKRCQAQLLPVNFEQIARSAVYFKSGQADELNQEQKDLLDLIIRYVKADPDVGYVFLDGHTDSYGTRRDNRQLSKIRTDLVLNHLIRYGMPQELISARYHGERYPVASNSSAAGRAKNRRVTIRLEKRDPLLEQEINTDAAYGTADLAPLTTTQ
ncbi:OmpA family protein [Allopseudospirillum japonicum]|uniref:OmpA family protein n=1 Tax=Allopseudospirillum japonicum TaxID=64971 RepID=A0A1H6SC24_9GAMM|nr:OmpA family protein [Allopseudospirillum japonicum]SEI61570.1 OmpA family protein [Allopseudospirillum japonicum]